MVQKCKIWPEAWKKNGNENRVRFAVVELAPTSPIVTSAFTTMIPAFLSLSLSSFCSFDLLIQVMARNMGDGR